MAASPVCRRWEFSHDSVNQASGSMSFVAKQSDTLAGVVFVLYSDVISTDEFMYRDVCRIQKVQ